MGEAPEGSNSVTVSSPAQSMPLQRFSHEALFYRGIEDMVATVAPFVGEGVDLGEPVLVAMLPDRTRALREALGPAASGVTFLDMEETGRNPARIIPAWQQFLDSYPDHRTVRGVGEPVWAGRREVEIDECNLHESLLNVAFDDGPAWRLLCPYDAAALSDTVVRNAIRTHPVVWGQERDVEYAGHEHALSTFTEALAPSHFDADEITFGGADLSGLRSIVLRMGVQSGIGRDAADDITLAAHELATNSVLHGGGGGSLRAWTQPDAFVVEVRDSGRIADPLVGRERGFALAEGGRGLWMANRLCDLVQVRSTPGGTVVRLFTWRQL